MASASLALLFVVGEAQAGDPDTRAERSQLDRIAALEGVSLWLSARFSREELAAFGPEDLQVESHSCGCFDRPSPHFPHKLIVFKTAKGDLVTRAEGQEMSVSIKPLAVRTGDEYCSVDAEEQCYGRFEHPCEFTDFRYGPQLAPYFPTCKTTEAEPALPPGPSGMPRLLESARVSE